MMTDVFFVSLTFDIASILIILGLCITPKSSDERYDPGAKLFTGMGICVIAGAVLDTISRSHLKISIFFVVIALPTLAEIFVVGFMFFLLLYTDYAFFGSRDHLRRHFAVYLAPFAFTAMVDIINLFAGILYTTGDDQVLVVNGLYYVVEVVTSLYLFIPAVYFLICFVKTGKRRFFHPLSICIPIVCGVALTYFTPYSAQYFGFAAGLAFLIFSRIDSRRFIDEETGFYNGAYLKYILQVIADNKGTYKGMITAYIGGNGKAFSGVLKEELPGGSEIVTLDKGRFVYLADTGNMTDLDAAASLIGLGAEEYDEDHPDKILLREVLCNGFKDDEAVRTAIETLTQHGSTD